MATIQSRNNLSDLENLVDQYVVIVTQQQDHIAALEAAVAKMQYDIQQLQKQSPGVTYRVAPGIHSTPTFTSKP